MNTPKSNDTPTIFGLDVGSIDETEFLPRLYSNLVFQLSPAMRFAAEQWSLVSWFVVISGQASVNLTTILNLIF